jgi:hypothetical protein
MGKQLLNTIKNQVSSACSLKLVIKLVMGHQLEGFDQLEIGLDLGQLEIRIGYDLGQLEIRIRIGYDLVT